MARKSVKISDDKCRDCAYEIFDVMGKYELSLGQEVRVMAAFLYSNIAWWHKNNPPALFEAALDMFVRYLYPTADSKEYKELETLLKKHFV